jgi:signal transduction histidine kinase
MPRREIEISLASGRTIPVGVSTSIIRDEREMVGGAVAVFQDLTEAREIEQRVRGNETLAAIGELASAVAHEIRNCLSPISGSVEVLASELEVDGEEKKLLDLIHRESRHLESFIGELLDFARVKPLVLEEIDITALLSEAIESVRRHPSFGHEISLELQCGKWEGYVTGDKEQLRSAFLNLGINAVEATPSGGKITVKLEYHEPGVTRRDGLVALDFEDTGTGIGIEQRRRVFEPFFTTKKKGSGLGLAVVKQVVERHGGRVSLESSEGAGTVVRLELPCRAVEVLHAA